jgi:hypothetical protein
VKEQTMAKSTMKKFEKSSYDNDKGVKEGSKADRQRDKKQFAKFKKATGNKGAGRGR